MQAEILPEKLCHSTVTRREIAPGSLLMSGWPLAVRGDGGDGDDDGRPNERET